MIHNTKRGIEDHLENHHGRGEPDCKGKEEKYLVQGSELSFPVCKQGCRKAEEHICWDKKKRKPECVGQAVLEGLTGEEPGIVFQPNKLESLSHD
jgi:hypothetical protein